MAFIIKDRIQETTTTTGTGSLALGGAVAGGFRTFSSVMATSDTTHYCIQDTANSAFEIGVGTLTGPTTLARTTVLSSSNANAAVNFAAGTKQVFMTLPADRALDVESDLSTTLPEITAEPGAPAAGLRVYAKNIAGRRVLKTQGPSGLDMAVQMSLWANSVTRWSPTNVTAGVGEGTNWTTAGTFASTLPSTTNQYTQTKRSQYSNVVTTANQILGVRAGEAFFFRGNAANMGGWFMFARVGFGTYTAGSRMFVGMAANTAGASVTGNPSAQLNMCGFGIDAGDTAITFMSNDGTGTATKTAIAGQPALASNQGYDCYIFCPPNATTIYYRLVYVSTNAEIVNSSVTTDLPTVNTNMSVQALASNAALTPVNSTQFQVNRIYVETDF